MDLQDVFISNLKRLRKQQNLTQEKLAELCNTETSYIGQIETRKRFPSLSFIEKIANVLRISPYILFKPVEEIEIDKKLNMQKELINTISNDITRILSSYEML